MSQIEKLVEKLTSKPVPKNFTWRELVKVLGHYGYELIPTKGSGGSRRCFVNKETQDSISGLHEPHPEPEIKVYVVKLVCRHLLEKGLIDEY
ncbi:MAG: type II toxin-antitoxin system HicA family toxin [Dehalococcoidia bacterium]|nr:type II toxin-antitoxin system HicA family toxin [Dehalococcoidia bacterium]